MANNQPKQVTNTSNSNMTFGWSVPKNKLYSKYQCLFVVVIVFFFFNNFTTVNVRAHKGTSLCDESLDSSQDWTTIT